MARNAPIPTEWDENAPEGDRYVVVGGSWSYGLNHEGSDVDLKGYYTSPSTALLGFNPTNETWVNTNPDVALHELGKFCTLALAGNPTVLEALAAPQIVETTPFADLLRANIGDFLSNRIRNTHFGFATGQLAQAEAKTRREETPRTRNQITKHLLHTFRVIEQGTRTLTTGEFHVTVENPIELRRLATLPYREAVTEAAEQLDALKHVPSVLDDNPNSTRIEALLIEERIRVLDEERKTL